MYALNCLSSLLFFSQQRACVRLCSLLSKPRHSPQFRQRLRRACVKKAEAKPRAQGARECRIDVPPRAKPRLDLCGGVTDAAGVSQPRPVQAAASLPREELPTLTPQHRNTLTGVDEVRLTFSTCRALHEPKLMNSLSLVLQWLALAWLTTSRHQHRWFALQRSVRAGSGLETTCNPL